jgi:hypothetical protein
MDGGMHWIDLAQDSDIWWVVKRGNEIELPQNAANFWTSWERLTSQGGLLHGLNKYIVVTVI